MKIAALLLILLLLAFGLAFAQADPGRLTIGPGDLLSLEVFDVPELKQEIRVSDRGEAEFPLIGVVAIAGMTTNEAGQRIAVLLKENGLVVNPQVSLLVREYATQGVAVNGEVRRPGVYRALAPRALSQVLSEAGGLTEAASPKITIQRAGGGTQTAIVRSGEPPTGLLLGPGDAVFVARAGIVYLVGDVARSGGYVMQDAGELSVAQLVAMGGGLLSTAKGQKAWLVRKSDEARQQQEIDVKSILQGKSPDIALKADDILFIPNSAWRSAATRLQNITQMTVGAAIYTSLN